MTPADLLRAFQWITVLAIIGSALFLGVEFIRYRFFRKERK